MTKLYRQIATCISAQAHCDKAGNAEMAAKWSRHLDYIEREYLPSGSGVDNGTKIDRELSTHEKLVFEVGFHHMDENGSYDGWTQHEIIVTGSLLYGFVISIKGRDRNNIKDYLADLFHTALDSDVELALGV